MTCDEHGVHGASPDVVRQAGQRHDTMAGSLEDALPYSTSDLILRQAKLVELCHKRIAVLPYEEFIAAASAVSPRMSTASTTTGRRG